MSNKIGLRTFSEESEFTLRTSQRDYSEATAQLIDEEISETFLACHRQVYDLLSSKKDLLDALVQKLLVHETLGTQEIEAVLGPPTLA